MGVDSALTLREGGDILALSNFPKVIPVPQMNAGLSFAGAAKIHTNWISSWLRDFAQKVSNASSLTNFADDLVKTINETPRDPDQRHIIHLAGWALAQTPQGTATVPRLFSITASEDGKYRWASMMPETMVMEMLAWRANRTLPYPNRIFSDGIPQQFATWISSTATPEFSKLMGSPVPYPQITAVAEYVRFLIRSIADLHRISRREAFVNEPVETLPIFPDQKTMFSTRY